MKGSKVKQVEDENVEKRREYTVPDLYLQVIMCCRDGIMSLDFISTPFLLFLNMFGVMSAGILRHCGGQW